MKRLIAERDYCNKEIYDTLVNNVIRFIKENCLEIIQEEMYEEESDSKKYTTILKYKNINQSDIDKLASNLDYCDVDNNVVTLIGYEQVGENQ